MSNKYVGKKIEDWRKDDKLIVLVTGVFDLLHIEHIRFLKKAREAGDILVVGIESDERVKRIKGVNRPINDVSIRLEQLRELKCVDFAFVLPSKFDSQDDWDGFMSKVRPDVYAVSSHTEYLKNKTMLAEKYGGKLEVVHEFNPEYSTSKLYQKLVQEL